MAPAPAQARALLASSVLCIAVGVGAGMLGMGAFGYHWEPGPTNLAGDGPGQSRKSSGRGANGKVMGAENNMSTSTNVSKLTPDLSSRPFQLKINRHMHASPHAVFEAWTTEKFDRWFAAPGTVMMKPQIDTPYFFEARHNGQRHPHYGRFLKLEPARLIEMTWLTAAGTKGAETVITIELTPRQDGGTELTLTHAGFPDDECRKGHEEAWPAGLEQLDKKFSSFKE